MYASGTPSGANVLSDLTDVNVPAPNDNDHMVYDDGSSLWLPEAAAGGGETTVDRGDPASADWTIGSGITADSTWRVLDLSSVVPAGAANKKVHFRVQIYDTTISLDFKMRKNGNTYDINAAVATTLIGGEYTTHDCSVFCDGDRKIEYLANTGLDVLNLTVESWQI